jgi:hypothetical protein
MQAPTLASPSRSDRPVQYGDMTLGGPSDFQPAPLSPHASGAFGFGGLPSLPDMSRPVGDMTYPSRLAPPAIRDRRDMFNVQRQQEINDPYIVLPTQEDLNNRYAWDQRRIETPLDPFGDSRRLAAMDPGPQTRARGGPRPEHVSSPMSAQDRLGLRASPGGSPADLASSWEARTKRFYDALRQRPGVRPGEQFTTTGYGGRTREELQAVIDDPASSAGAVQTAQTQLAIANGAQGLGRGVQNFAGNVADGSGGAASGAWDTVTDAAAIPMRVSGNILAGLGFEGSAEAAFTTADRLALSGQATGGTDVPVEGFSLDGPGTDGFAPDPGGWNGVPSIEGPDGRVAPVGVTPTGPRGPSGGIAGVAAPATAGGALSTYDQMLTDALAENESDRAQAKWLLLAEIGAGMLGSTAPGFAGTGQAISAGLGSYTDAKDALKAEAMGIAGLAEDQRRYEQNRADQFALGSMSGSGSGAARRAYRPRPCCSCMDRRRCRRPTAAGSAAPAAPTYGSAPSEAYAGRPQRSATCGAIRATRAKRRRRNGALGGTPGTPVTGGTDPTLSGDVRLAITQTGATYGQHINHERRHRSYI